MISPRIQADMDTICKSLPAAAQEINILLCHSRTFRYSFSPLWPDDSLIRISELTKLLPANASVFLSFSLFTVTFSLFVLRQRNAACSYAFVLDQAIMNALHLLPERPFLKPLALLPHLATQSCHTHRVFYQC
jgi:hypothetical protein